MLGQLYEQAGEYSQALPYLEEALKLLNDGEQKAQALIMTADALTQVGRFDAALGSATEALNISIRLDNLAAQASALRARAEAVYDSSREKALADLKRALLLSEQANDLRTQAVILNDEGAAVQESGSPFEVFRKALVIEDRIHDCRDKIDTVANLATLEFDRGQIRNAQADYDETVSLEKQVGDRTLEAETLHQLGYFHWELGDLGEALSLFNQALEIKQEIGALSSEAETLAAIAGVYRDAQLPDAALEAYLKVLPLFQKTKNMQWQVWVLNNLGTVEADLHHPDEARSYYSRASVLACKIRDDSTRAFAAWGIGELEQDDASASYFKSLRMAREFEQPDLEGEVDASLMDHFRTHGQPNVAIFFGKRAVNQFLSLRRNMGGMSNALTSSFLQMKSATYRTLAEILIDQGRLVEAQQVLDLLKIQQYSDYVGEEPRELSQPLANSPREAPLQDEFDKQLARLASLDQAIHAAESANHRQSSTVVRARTAFGTAKAQFNVFVQNLYQQLEGSEGPPIALQNVTGSEMSLQKLLAADSHIAALYTIEGADRYSVMVITRAGRFVRSYPITQDQLDEKCRNFVKLLSHRNPRFSAEAEELYGVVLEPIRKDLEALGVKTLVWYLDGSLRYIPIAALLDPQTHRYLVDDYSDVNFTPLDRSIGDSPDLEDAHAIGMGITNQYFPDLAPLANVREELDSVVSDPAVQGSHGVLPGTILIDGQFTEKAIEEHLKSQTVVHIASHFVLEPGNDDLSFLLLGGKDQDHSGYKYSLADFEKSKDLHLDGTSLLTLSACETGAANERDVCFRQTGNSVATEKCTAGNALQRENGVVMESISEVALEKGAEAVISSLWSVNDRSTSLLMADFYRRWIGSKGTLTKAEALREAELDLLHGNIMPQSDGSHRGLSEVDDKSHEQTGPAGFAHPYYWAPFVMTGNWQ